MQLLPADSPALWNEARRLVQEYADSLGIDLSFQDFARELQQLSEEYAPPRGCFVVAQIGERAVGCGGFRPFRSQICEMKRLYVVPAAQHGGVGRTIATFLVGEAKRRGYEAMVLDTLPTMTSARSLYSTLGFAQIEPYRFNPVAGATFWRLGLDGLPAP